MGDDISLAHAEPAFACGRRGSLVMLVWRGEPTQECLERSFDVITREIEAAGGRIGLIALIESGSPPPALALFPWVARKLDALGGMIATAGVLEDRGALGVRVLDGLSKVIQLAARRLPARVCADVPEAASWMAARLGVPSSEAFRRDAVELAERVRASLDSA